MHRNVHFVDSFHQQFAGLVPNEDESQKILEAVETLLSYGAEDNATNLDDVMWAMRYWDVPNGRHLAFYFTMTNKSVRVRSVAAFPFQFPPAV
jgi:hypothetical protein